MVVRPRRQQLSDEAASYLRDLIMAGEIEPGTFLRPEGVAELLEMSITPVREALLTLRGEDFLRQVPRRGFLVAELTSQDVKDVFWVQSVLAGESAARAAVQITAERLEELTEIQRRIDTARAAEDAAGVDVANYQFHRLVNQVAHSPKIAWFLGLTDRYVPRRYVGSIEGWSTASVHDHWPIVTALKAGDVHAARDAMASHIQHAGKLLIAHRSRATG
jgi:DNA-binding GntR family transcriptional regulator